MSILNFALHGAGARRMSVLEKGLLKLQVRPAGVMGVALVRKRAAARLVSQEDLERGHRQLQALAAQGDAAAVAIHGILQCVLRVAAIRSCSYTWVQSLVSQAC